MRHGVVAAFDADSDGIISSHDFVRIFNMFGIPITPDDARCLVQSVLQQVGGTAITHESFQKFYETHKLTEVGLQALRQCLQILTPSDNSVNMTEHLMKISASMNIPLNREDASMTIKLLRGAVASRSWWERTLSNNKQILHPILDVGASGDEFGLHLPVEVPERLSESELTLILKHSSFED